jgi:pimeloyl-ACP methyl ester carboxylesterase
MTTQPLDRWVMLRGLRFHYLEWGAAAAPPLVLLHGYTSHAHSWDTFSRDLSEHFHIFALDQRGHGESAWTDDYSAERMIEDVEAFVKALRLSKFDLLGLSMGGRNAYGYAARQLDRLKRLVIVDIGPETMTSGSTRIRQGALANDVFETEEEAIQVARHNNPRAPEAELRHRFRNGLMLRDDGKWTYRYDKALRDPNRPRPQPDPAAHWAMLAQITCPTLLVRGAESDVLSVEVAERMAQTMPNCKLVTVPDAGHSIPLDNPSGFIAAVKPFLLN